MGLREINASRTKEMIVSAALDLIFERGYDGTTMEDIAQHAGIGSSTLYRYFPTKESVVISPLGDPGLMAKVLRERPPEERAEVALGHALVAFLEYAGQVPEQGERLGELLQSNARPRARLMEWFGDTHAQLVVALRERLAGPDAELRAGAMAWTAVWILQRTRQVAEEGGGRRDLGAVARDIMATLAQHPVPTPRLD